MLPLIFVFLIITSLLGPSTQLPGGAPESVCHSLMPSHNNIPAQTIPTPYRISPSSTIVGQGQVLRVNIDSNPPNLVVKGFMLHARSTSPPFNVVRYRITLELLSSSSPSLGI